jgi:hypothetical protein
MTSILLRHLAQFQRAGGIDDARILGNERQVEGRTAGGDDALLEADHLLRAGLVLRAARGFLDFEVVGVEEMAVAAHGLHLARLGHAGQAAGELADHLFLVRAQLVDVHLGRGETDAEVAGVFASSITAATCSSALEGMQPTLRQTPPSVA